MVDTGRLVVWRLFLGKVGVFLLRELGASRALLAGICLPSRLVIPGAQLIYRLVLKISGFLVPVQLILSSGGGRTVCPPGFPNCCHGSPDRNYLCTACRFAGRRPFSVPEPALACVSPR